MIKWMKANKLVSLLLGVFCVIVLVGVVLYGALGGFNNALDRPEQYTFEVRYDVVGERFEEQLQDECEKEFDAKGLGFAKKEILSEVDSSNFNATTDKVLTYTFAAGASEKDLTAAAEAVNAFVKAEEATNPFYDSETATLLTAPFASVHKLSGERFYEPAWRGAIALFVGAVVALAYVCIRYGVSCGVAGLVCCLHDTLLTAALFAATRFPVYAMAPLLYAGVAAFMSVLLWIVLCGKLRAQFKDAENGTTAEEIITSTVKANVKTVLFTALPFLLAIAVLGAIAVSGTALLVLPMLVAAALPLYSVLFLGPAVCIPIRTAFDARRAKAAQKGRYVGKKKAQETEN